MPKLTKVDVARHLHISRQTLYEWIQKGRISIGPDGYIDSSEVARLSGTVTQSDVTSERHHRHEVTSPHGDTTRELIEVLKAQLADAQARERFLQEQVDRLTGIIDRRLLESPRPAPSPPPPTPTYPQPTHAQRQRVRDLLQQRRDMAPSAAPLPETWQRILEYLREQATPRSPLDVQQALGLATSPRHMMNRMVQAGVL